MYCDYSFILVSCHSYYDIIIVVVNNYNIINNQYFSIVLITFIITFKLKYVLDQGNI